MHFDCLVTYLATYLKKLSNVQCLFLTQQLGESVLNEDR